MLATRVLRAAHGRIPSIHFLGKRSIPGIYIYNPSLTPPLHMQYHLLRDWDFRAKVTQSQLTVPHARIPKILTSPSSPGPRPLNMGHWPATCQPVILPQIHRRPTLNLDPRGVSSWTEASSRGDSGGCGSASPRCRLLTTVQRSSKKKKKKNSCKLLTWRTPGASD